MMVVVVVVVTAIIIVVVMTNLKEWCRGSSLPTPHPPPPTIYIYYRYKKSLQCSIRGGHIYYTPLDFLDPSLVVVVVEVVY